jgi:hypothetical protein
LNVKPKKSIFERKPRGKEEYCGWKLGDERRKAGKRDKWTNKVGTSLGNVYEILGEGVTGERRKQSERAADGKSTSSASIAACGE